MRCHLVNGVNWAPINQRWLRQQWNSLLFSDESRFTIHREDDRVRVYGWSTELVMQTVAYLNEIVLGVGVLSWFGWALHMAFALISWLSKAI